MEQLKKEISNILDPETELPMPVTGRDVTPIHELIRIHNALLKLAEAIDRLNEKKQDKPLILN